MVITQFVEQIFDVSSRVCLLRFATISVLKKDQTNLKKKKKEVLITKHKTKLQTLMSFQKIWREFFTMSTSWLIFVG